MSQIPARREGAPLRSRYGLDAVFPFIVYVGRSAD